MIRATRELHWPLTAVSGRTACAPICRRCASPSFAAVAPCPLKAYAGQAATCGELCARLVRADCQGGNNPRLRVWFEILDQHGQVRWLCMSYEQGHGWAAVGRQQRLLSCSAATWLLPVASRVL